MFDNKQPFKKIKHLGTGGFASTWYVQVLDPDLIEEWGLKEVAIKIPLDKQKEKVLKKEVQLTGGLQLQISQEESKNLVEYVSFEIFEEKLVMVMKYVKNGSLRSIIGKIGHWERVELNKSITIAKGVLTGLSVIHRRHIVHRDIKPENILLDGEIPKIADFGIGRMLRTNELASSTVGTLYYMSPELLSEESQFNTDIWSFGITFYEMLCGQFPFGIGVAMPPGKVIDLIRDARVTLKFPHEVNIPEQLKMIIDKSLMRDPMVRYQTADEMLYDLNRYFKNEDDECIERCVAELQDLDFKTAERRLKELVNKYPQNPASYISLGEYYNRCQRYNDAVQIFDKGLTINPDNALLIRDKALALYQSGQKLEAKKVLKKALELGLDQKLEKQAKSLLKIWGGK